MRTVSQGLVIQGFPKLRFRDQVKHYVIPRGVGSRFRDFGIKTRVAQPPAVFKAVENQSHGLNSHLRSW
jgi:hypothetical protein